MPADPGLSGTPVASRQWSRRRFALLRTLIQDTRRRHRLVAVGVLIALCLAGALTLIARIYTVLPLDVWFTQELQERQWASIAPVMYGVSIFGYTPWSWLTVAVGTGLVGLLAGWRDGLYLLAITAGQGLINVAIKTSVGRPRPIYGIVEVFVAEHGFSFPSGHVMFYTVFFGFLLFLTLVRGPRNPIRWLLSATFLTLILLVGPARIVLGSHWLSDVMAAYLLSLVILVLAIEVYLNVVAPRMLAAAGDRAGGRPLSP
jgi:membrane-associated phospholipid phosphatase